MKKIVAVVSVCLFFSTFLFAHGKGDVAERSVNQDESWRETFDLTDKKEENIIFSCVPLTKAGMSL